MKLKKGDNIMVIAGKDKGQTGSISEVMPEKERVLVNGLNTVQKRAKPRRQGEKGQTVAVSRSIHMSNVMLICKNCKKPARVGYRMEGDKKVRFCKQCEASN